ncbi:unnamed protein product [Heterobilharzia americana]|nr:unnamed protein product [Heterobilharzia americana]CAH8483841.1 unnamed protein product [Heterobilharzia americana]
MFKLSFIIQYFRGHQTHCSACSLQQLFFIIIPMGHVLATYRDPKSMPDIFTGPVFDPLDGFPEGRKQREFILTEEEMMAAGLKPRQRDYCAHILIALNKCRREHTIPRLYCSDLHHQYSQCQREDQLLRRKEYERERRQLQRHGRQPNSDAEEL